MPIAWRRIVLPGTINIEPHGNPNAIYCQFVSGDFASITSAGWRRSTSTNSHNWNDRTVCSDYILPNSIFRHVCSDRSTHTNKWNVCPYSNHFSSAITFPYNVAETNRQLPSIRSTDDFIDAIRFTFSSPVIWSISFTDAINISISTSFHIDRDTICESLFLSDTYTEHFTFH
jgi:hypothetical protein